MENLSSNFWIIPLYLLSNLSFLFNLVCTPCTPLLISVFHFDNSNYFVEHNELLSEEEIKQIVDSVESDLLKMGIVCEDIGK